MINLAAYDKIIPEYNEHWIDSKYKAFYSKTISTDYSVYSFIKRYNKCTRQDDLFIVLGKELINGVKNYYIYNNQGYIKIYLTPVWDMECFDYIRDDKKHLTSIDIEEEDDTYQIIKLNY